MQKVRHTHTNEGVYKYLVCLQQANVCPASEAVLFLYVGYYILVYLQGFFLHCVNTRQQEMLCHSLFLPGKAGFFGLIVSKLNDGFEAVSLPLFSAALHAPIFPWYVIFLNVEPEQT